MRDSYPRATFSSNCVERAFIRQEAEDQCLGSRRLKGPARYGETDGTPHNFSAVDNRITAVDGSVFKVLSQIANLA
jgi:hypothetical protein